MAHYVPSHADLHCFSEVISNIMTSGMDLNGMTHCASPYLDLHCLHRYLKGLQLKYNLDYVDSVTVNMTFFLFFLFFFFFLLYISLL